jgi:hypothetical protein
MPPTPTDEALRLEIAAELKAHREACAAIEALPKEERDRVRRSVVALHWALFLWLPADCDVNYHAFRAELETAIYPIYLKRRNAKA